MTNGIYVKYSRSACDGMELNGAKVRWLKW